MYGRIESLIDIMYNLIVCAVYFNWNCFNNQLDRLRGWWEGMIDDIYNAINHAVDVLGDWVESWINYLKAWVDWLYEQVNSLWDSVVYYYNQAVNYAYEIVNDVYAWSTGAFDAVYHYAYDQAAGVLDWAIGAINAVYYYAYDIVVDVYEYMSAYIDPYLVWLDDVSYFINWLADQAWYALQQFLAHPVDFVLGLFADSLRFWLPFLNDAGEALVAFVTEVMVDVYNLWQSHGDTLWDFLTDPLIWLFDLMSGTVLDWLAGLLADNW